MNIFFKKKKKVVYYNSTDKSTPYALGRNLIELVEEEITRDRPIVFLCIGTDRATGDCLGPIIGYKLSKIKRNVNYFVYGTLEEPVHAKNLKTVVETIYKDHKDAFIVAIDASLGQSSHVGYITLGEGPLNPGAGVNKDLPPVGDIYITGIVNFSGLLDHMLLQTTRLNLVMSLADQIFSAINYCLSHLTRLTVN